jgi:hypothetical protein
VEKGGEDSLFCTPVWPQGGVAQQVGRGGEAVQGGRWPWWVWALIGPAVLVGIILAVWNLPVLLYGDVSRASDDARLQAASSFRTAIVAGLAGLAALGSLAMASRTYRLTQQGQLTDRYTKAIEQLGSDKPDVRLGGIYTLERIARDSAYDRATVAEVLTAFIRGRAPWPPARPDQPGEDTPITEVLFLRYRAPDVQAALTVLGRQPSMTESQPLNLSDTDLRRADLSNADLQETMLRGFGCRGQTSEQRTCRGWTCPMLSSRKHGPTPRRSGRTGSTGRPPGSSCWRTSWAARVEGVPGDPPRPGQPSARPDRRGPVSAGRPGRQDSGMDPQDVALTACPGRAWPFSPPRLDQCQHGFASRGGELQHAFELSRDAVLRRHPLWLPRIEDKVRTAAGGWRVGDPISSLSELAPATTETWTEVDRSADHHVEVEGLPPTMRHLMPVVPDPVHDAVIAV